MHTEKIRNFLFFLTVAILSGIIGYRLAFVEIKSKVLGNTAANFEIINKTSANNNPADFALFWQVWDELGKKYVDKSKFDSQKMVYGAISGMVSSLGDPYTVFLPPSQNKASKEDLNGTFEGIGAELGMKDGRIVVVAPLSDSPAEKAGLLTSDIILKIDGQETGNLALPEAVSKIRGPKGSTVTLNVLHPKTEQPVDIKIFRDKIILKSVEWKLVNNVAHLRLMRFGDETNAQWDKAISEIKSSKAKGLVLDLRNNPGGLLAGAVYIASEFLPSGVVVKQVSYNGDVQTYSVNRLGKLLSLPMVVLVNQGTASASEILGGSLQVAGRSRIIGVQSFGKGSVQEAEDLPNGAGLHVTVAKWLLSNDIWINGTGLTPDVKIENDIKEPTKDLQLDKAIELLK